VLTVGDDELAVEDNDDALLEVAEPRERHVGVPENSCGWATHDLASQVWLTRILGECGNKIMT
jgi:hypothetical protein